MNSIENDLLYIQFKQYVQNNVLIEPAQDYFLSISGGPDSVCLLKLLIQYQTEVQFNLSLVHINYQHRGIESELDEELIRNISIQNNLQLIISKVKYPGKRNFQAWARNERIKTYLNIYKNNKATFILAHNKGDVIEGFFIRILRGSSIENILSPRKVHTIQGMKLIRPLLFASKRDIIHFLDTNHIKYRIDQSNNERTYLRNRLRLDLLPQLKIIKEGFEEKIISFLDKVEQDSNYLDSIAKKKIQTHFIANDSASFKYPIDLLNKEAFPIKERIIRNMLELFEKDVHAKIPIKTSVINRISRSCLSNKGSKVVFQCNTDNYVCSILLEYNFLVFKKYRRDLKRLNDEKLLLKLGLNTFSENNIMIQVCNAPNLGQIRSDSLCGIIYYQQCYLDSLIIRGKKSGDKINLQSGNRHKSIKNILIDAKVPQLDRKNVLILERRGKIVGYAFSMEGKILTRISFDSYIIPEQEVVRLQISRSPLEII